MMDEIRCLLEEMADAGIRLWVEDGKLKFRAPSGAMTVERANLIKKNRDAVIAALNEPRPIKREPEKRYDPYPLTDIQQAYQLGKSEAYPYGGVGCQGYMEISLGGVEFERLNNAWRKVVARHDVLHSVISEDGYQQVLEEYDVGLIEFVEAESRSLEEVASECRRTMDHKDYATSVHPYELKVSTDGIKSILHISVNLALCDFLSITIILNDLARAYDGEQLDSSDEISFRDFVMDAKTRGVSSPSLKADEEYWSARIDELPPAPMLPMGPNPDVRTGVRFIRHQMSLTDNEWAEFRRTSAEKGVTPTAALVAAFSDTLALWAESSDFTINMTMLNRGDDIPGIMRTVGDFTMSSLLGLIRDERAPFFSRARAAQSQLWSDLEHRSFSGVSVLREIARRRGRAGGGALMPFVFTSSIGLRGGSSLSETSLFRGSRVIGGLSQTPQVWLDCQAMEWNGSLVINWDERAGVFPDGLVSDAFSSFEQTLRSLASSKATWEETRIVHLPQKQKLVRIAANDTGKEIVSSTLHSDFMKTALSHPELPAVRLGDEFVTYAELRALSLKVAHKLKRGVRTAIILEKSIAQVVAVIGCSLAGAPFIPLSPDHPRSRVDTVMGNAEVGAVLAKAETLERLDLAGKEEAMDIDLILSDDISANFEDRTLPSDEAYVIYTSGSTGVPKGVAVSHAAAWNTIADINSRFNVRQSDKIIGLAELTFDLAIYDIFGILSVGGELIFPEPSSLNDPSSWCDVVVKRKVTIWNSVPQQMQMLSYYLDTAPDVPSLSLRLALLSGDWIPVSLPNDIADKIPHLKMVSLGGATEGGIWSIFHEINPSDSEKASIPYGKPLANQEFDIVGRELESLPLLVPGEIIISGKSLASGYLNDPVRTSESFIMRDGVKCYRTGDMGKYLENGDIEFLGRADQQIKVRGYRVELGEVEAALEKAPGVDKAVAFAADNDKTDKHLLAAVIAEKVNPDKAESLFKRSTVAMKECMRDRFSKMAVNEVAEYCRKVDEVCLSAMMNLIADAVSKDGFSIDDMMHGLNAKERNRRLLERWAKSLVDMKALNAKGDSFCFSDDYKRGDIEALWQQLESLELKVEYSKGLLSFLHTCIDSLSGLVSGKVDHLSILFPEGGFDVAASTYRDNLASKTLNSTLVSMVSEFARIKGGLRVLEVGAGTGGSSDSLIDALEGTGSTYLFTDISEFFLSEARNRYEGKNWIGYAIYDVNKDARTQGLADNSFDLIVGANVLHNCIDVLAGLGQIKSLLSPGGILAFIEATRESFPLMVSMDFQDALGMEYSDLRAGTSKVFLNLDEWSGILAKAGFGLTDCSPTNEEPDLFGQHLIVAQAKADIAALSVDDVVSAAQETLPSYMIPEAIGIIDTLPLSRNGKVDRAELKRLPLLGRTQSKTAGIGDERDSYRSDLEARLAVEFSEVLGADSVRRDDDFFELGGDSLLATKLAAQIKKNVDEAAELEWEWLLRKMMESPTVSSLALALSSTEEAEKAAPKGQMAPVVVLKDGNGDGVVNVLVHDGTGTLDPYRDLISASGDKLIIGVQMPDMQKALDYDTRSLIETLGREYADRLSEWNGCSFRIVGYCMGGLIATEIARNLMEQGETVADLFVISSYGFPFKITEDVMIEYAFARVLNAPTEDLGYPKDDEAFANAIADAQIRHPGVLDLLDGEGPVVEKLKKIASLDSNERMRRILSTVTADSNVVERLTQIYRTFKHNLIAVMEYESKPYLGPIHFLRDSGRMGLFKNIGGDETVFWNSVALMGIDTQDIEGDHFTCISGEHAKDVAKRVGLR